MLSAAMIGAVSGCALDEPAQPAGSVGNDALGVARFAIRDTADVTTVVGLDADGREVARMDLVHGEFAPTGVFAREDFEGMSRVDGRKLDVSVGGALEMVLEKAGYEPIMKMPPPPASNGVLAGFLADPHVAGVLERWGLGFEGVGGDELAYTSGTWNTNFVAFSGVKYWSTSTNYVMNGAAYTAGLTGQGKYMNWCSGGDVKPDMGLRISRASGSDSEYVMVQACTTGGVQWMATKACPNNSTTTMNCGTSSGACVNCATYFLGAGGTYGPGSSDTNGLYSMNLTSSGAQFCYNEAVRTLTYKTSTTGTTVTITNVPGALSAGSGGRTIGVCNGSSIDLNSPTGIPYEPQGYSIDGTNVTFNPQYTVGMSGDHTAVANYHYCGTGC